MLGKGKYKMIGEHSMMDDIIHDMIREDDKYNKEYIRSNKEDDVVALMDDSQVQSNFGSFDIDASELETIH